MRQLFSRLLAVALLLVACSGAVWGDGLKVTITKSDGTQNTKTGQESMEKALEGYFLQGIIGVEVSAGSFETADWIWLKKKRWGLAGLKKFEVTGGIGSVADIPNTTKDSPYFSSSLNELHVAKLKKVGDYAFYNCSGLMSVSLPTATMIGEYAFSGCQRLTSVSLPVATEIGTRAFSDCTGLTSVSLPVATEIGTRAFWDCIGLASVSLPAATKIDEEAFSDCVRLASLQLGAIPPSVKLNAFLECPLVRKLKLLDADGSPLTGDAFANAISRYRAVEDGDTEDNLWYVWAFENAPASNLSGTIEGDEFANAASLEVAMKDKDLSKVKEVTITGGRFQVSDWVFLLENGQDKLAIETFTIESSVDKVAYMPDLSLFGSRYLPKAQKVSMAKLKRVGVEAFDGCKSLTSVSLPAATEIGNGVFRGCEALTSVSLPAATEIGSSAFSGCEALTSISLPAATEIGWSAFKDCKGLTSVSLPAATKIDEEAFSNCTTLTVLQLPAVTEIGNRAFRGCTGLTSVSLPAVTEIGEDAFYGCTGLTSVSLPAVTEIGEDAFYGCTGLTSLELGATPPSVKLNAFLGCPLVRKLKLLDADGTLLTGNALTNARSQYRAVEDGDTEDNLWYVWAFEDAPASNLSGTIDGVAFSGAASLEVAMKGKDLSKVKEVTITGGRFQHSDWFFLLDKGEHGLAIKKFTIESSVDRVADMPDLPYSSSRYLPKAQKVSIAMIQKIGSYAFYRCTGLTSVSLQAAIEIGEDAFRSCEALTSVSLPAVTKIGSYAFRGCNGLTSVSLPAATKIDEEAFIYCEGLTSVSLPVATEIGNDAFQSCKALTSVSLPAATKIGRAAFYGCTGLTSVSLPATTEIGSSAFSGYTGLTSLELGATPPSVKLSSFFGCPLARKLKLLDADGTPLTGNALTNARSQYRAVEDGDTEDNLWYGWAFEEAPAGNLSGTIDGVTFSGATSLEAAMKDKDLSKVKEVTITGGRFQHSDWFFLLDKGEHGLAIKKFTIESSVDRVADMPDLPYSSSRYLPKAQKVSIAMIQKIGSYAFYRCTGLTSVSLQAAIEIGEDAFRSCEALTSVSLPVATKIGNEAFYGCTGLTSVPLPVATKIDRSAFEDCKGLMSASLPAATEIGWYAFRGCEALTSVSLPVAIQIGERAFRGCTGLSILQLGATPPLVGWNAFDGCPGVRTLIITDAAGVPLVGQALAAAGNKYYRDHGASYGWYWYGWGIQDVTKMGSVEIHPSDAGTVSITRKDGGAVVNEGDALARGELLIVTIASKSGYKYKKTTAVRAKDNGNNEWEVTLMTGLVIFTVEFEEVATLGSTIITPSDAGEVTITRKYGGEVVNPGDALDEGAVLVVEGKPMDGFRFKAITAEGAHEIRDKEWQVTATSGEVIFTVEFEKLATLGATVITPAGSGTVSITRKASGDMVNKGDALTKDEVLIVKGEPDGTHKVKKITAAGATNTKGNEWKVTANPGEQVVFTVEFEKLATLGATVITPAGSGTVSITRKASGDMVNKGDALTKDEVLIVKGEPDGTHKVKKITAAGATNTSGNEWKVTAMTGKVTFTVEFEKKPEGESNNPTPVESVLLAQAQLSPNPTDGQVTIDAGSTIAHCEVYSGTGALLQTIETPESVFTIDLAASPSGVYLVRLVDIQGGCKTLRVVKL